MITTTPAMTESQLQAAIIEAARWHGWLVYHTHDSRRSAAGFPDLIMVREARMIAAELKSEKGRPTREQRQWISELRAVAAHTDPLVMGVYLWRPEDWPDRILAVLR